MGELLSSSAFLCLYLLRSTTRWLLGSVGNVALPLLLWRRRIITRFARGDIEHTLCPLVKVAGAFGMLFGHGGIMCARAAKFQSFRECLIQTGPLP